MASLGAAHADRIEQLLDYMVPNPKMLPIIDRGLGAEVQDEQGKSYIDFMCGPGVASVGHCHPKVVAAIRDQVGKLLQSPGRFHSRLAMELAERLAGLTGNRLTKTYFANSGAEANDSATKLVLRHALVNGNRGSGIIAYDYGYHGRTSLALSLTGLSDLKKGFGPYAAFPGIAHVQFPYFYRCPFGSRTPEECGDRAAQALREAIKSRLPGEAAMMIVEPILGVGGIVIPPDNYWSQVEEICAENRITLVMDEIFVGFGRTGKMFAHQHWNVKPSVITFAKAIGGGLPIGGFIASADVAAAFGPNDHNTTTGANSQAGLAAGHAVLDILAEEDLAGRAAAGGERLLEGLRRIQHGNRHIGDLRGLGLVVGIEIVEDLGSKRPSPELAKSLQTKLRNKGLIVGVGGPFDNVLRLSPPLVLTNDQIDHSLSIFAEVFADHID